MRESLTTRATLRVPMRDALRVTTRDALRATKRDACMSWREHVVGVSAVCEGVKSWMNWREHGVAACEEVWISCRRAEHKSCSSPAKLPKDDEGHVCMQRIKRAFEDEADTPMKRRP